MCIPVSHVQGFKKTGLSAATLCCCLCCFCLTMPKSLCLFNLQAFEKTGLVEHLTTLFVPVYHKHCGHSLLCLQGFEKTGLGERVANIFVRLFGRSTLVRRATRGPLVL